VKTTTSSILPIWTLSLQGVQNPWVRPWAFSLRCKQERIGFLCSNDIQINLAEIYRVALPTIKALCPFGATVTPDADTIKMFSSYNAMTHSLVGSDYLRRFPEEIRLRDGIIIAQGRRHIKLKLGSIITRNDACLLCCVHTVDLISMMYHLKIDHNTKVYVT
jgi:hypothetical protein